STTRAAQRKARLMQIEYQQQLEDMEALRMSEEQAYTLMQSFSDVKVEFCDLDGLQWSGSALRKRAVSVSRPDPSPGRTVRAVVSPVKAVLELQKHGAPSGRDLDSRPPAKQRRRSRSPVKGAFNKLETP
ncbi:hypothetical protein EV360DRAFT_29531, partial [Lentinula raphanica]